MKKQIVAKSQVKRNENFTAYVIVDGKKVKAYYYGELKFWYYWTKNNQPVAATVIS